MVALLLCAYLIALLIGFKFFDISNSYSSQLTCATCDISSTRCGLLLANHASLVRIYANLFKSALAGIFSIWFILKSWSIWNMYTLFVICISVNLNETVHFKLFRMCFRVNSFVAAIDLFQLGAILPHYSRLYQWVLDHWYPKWVIDRGLLLPCPARSVCGDLLLGAIGLQSLLDHILVSGALRIHRLTVRVQAQGLLRISSR